MNVIVFASRKGGSGKSTLTAHLAAHANRPSRRCMLIDCDPQGSISLWHKLRGTSEPQLRDGSRGGVKEIVEKAAADGVEWVFVDTPPNMSRRGDRCDQRRDAGGHPGAARGVRSRGREGDDRLRAPVEEAVRAGDQRGAGAARQHRVAVRHAGARGAGRAERAGVGRADHPSHIYSLSLEYGEGAREYDADSPAAAEVASLWGAIERSVKAIHGAYAGAAMHRVAA